jgi:hypothetical protein
MIGISHLHHGKIRLAFTAAYPGCCLQRLQRAQVEAGTNASANLLQFIASCIVISGRNTSQQSSN